MKAAEEFPKVVGPMIEQGYKIAKKVKERIGTGIQKAIEKGKEFAERHPFVKKTIKTAVSVLFPSLKERIQRYGIA